MRPRLLAFAVVVLLLASLLRANRLIEGNDPEAEPFKKAVAALVEAMGTGSLEKARAQYVGEGADLDLLKAYIDSINASKAVRAAVDAKFGADPKRKLIAMDDAIARTAVHDFNTVIFDDGDRNAASSSADSPLGVGIEFKKVNGEWKVRSLASEPNKPDEHTARLKAYTNALNAVTAKVKAGGYASAADAVRAVREASGKLRP